VPLSGRGETLGGAEGAGTAGGEKLVESGGVVLVAGKEREPGGVISGGGVDTDKRGPDGGESGG
jgi:hypothetical protein